MLLTGKHLASLMLKKNEAKFALGHRKNAIFQPFWQQALGFKAPIKLNVSAQLVCAKTVIFS